MEVVFRKFKEGDIIALFPDTLSRGNIESYMHVGQHSMADVTIVYDTKLAKPEEYADLLAELIRIGYKPKVGKRICWKS